MTASALIIINRDSFCAQAESIEVFSLPRPDKLFCEWHALKSQHCDSTFQSYWDHDFKGCHVAFINHADIWGLSSDLKGSKIDLRTSVFRHEVSRFIGKEQGEMSQQRGKEEGMIFCALTGKMHLLMA